MPPMDVYQIPLASKYQKMQNDVIRQWSFDDPPTALRLASGTTLITVGVLGMVGNILVILTILRILQYRRTLPNVLIRNLALVDLCTIPFTYTPALISYFSSGYKGGKVVCNAHSFSILFLNYTSLAIVTFMSVDRYLALAQPFWYERYLTPDGIWLKVLYVFMLSIAVLIGLLPITGIAQNVLHYPGSYCLFNLKSVSNASLAYNSMVFIILSSFILTIILCNVAVTAVAYKLYCGSQQLRYLQDPGRLKGRVEGREEIALIRLSIVLMAVYLCCWIPFLVRLMLGLIGRPFSPFLDFLSARAASLHSILNPWLYAVLRRQYREAFTYFIQQAVSVLSCGLLQRPRSTFDEIIDAPGSSTNPVVESGRRKSHEQRVVLMKKKEEGTDLSRKEQGEGL